MFEKEAEEYVRKIRPDVINWGGTEPEERFYNEIKFKQAYLAGAEPREKRIAEIEAQIEKLKCCENCADYDGQDCDMDNENCCRCFTGDENDDCYWRLKEEQEGGI